MNCECAFTVPKQFTHFLVMSDITGSATKTLKIIQYSCKNQNMVNSVCMFEESNFI